MSGMGSSLAEQGRRTASAPRLHTLMSKAVMLGGAAYAALSVAQALIHRSETPAVLDRYSLTYLIFVVYLLAAALIWVGLTALSLHDGDRLRHPPGWLSALPPTARPLAGLPVAALYGMGLYLGRRAPAPVAPEIRFMPLALLSVGLLLLLAAAIRPAEARSAPPPRSLPAPDRLLSRLDPVARWLADDRRATLVALTLVTLITALLIGPILAVPEHTTFGDDAFRLGYLFEDYVTKALGEGRIPYWNPYLFSGYPALAHPQTLVFYPLQLIFRFLPASRSITLALALHIWLAGVGMYLLCRQFGLHPLIGMGCALAFMLNGRIVWSFWAGYRWTVYAIALIPWAWLFIDQALEDGNLLATAGAGLTVGMIVLAGHVAWPFYILMFFGFYALATCLRHWVGGERGCAVRTALRFGLIVALGLGLAAIELVPAIVLSGQTSLVAAGGYNLRDANLGAFTLPRLLSFLIPEGFAPGAHEWVSYVGVLPLVAAPFAFSRRKSRPLTVFLGAIAIYYLLLAFGRGGLIFTLFYRLLPPFRMLRIPPRGMVVWVTVVIVLGGIGLQALLERSVDRRVLRWGRYGLFGLAMFLLSALAAIVYADKVGLPDLDGGGTGPLTPAAVLAIIIGIGAAFNLLIALLPRQPWLLGALLAVGGAVAGASLIDSDSLTLSPDVLTTFGKTLGLLAVGALLFIWLWRSQRPAAALLLIVAAIGIDMVTYGQKYVFGEAPPHNVLEGHPEHVELIASGAEGRMFDRTWIPTGVTFTNLFIQSEINVTDAYESVILARYDRFNVYARDAYESCDLRPLSFMNVTHVLIPPDDMVCPGLEPIARTPDYTLYRNPDALPRAYWVHQARVAQGWEATQAIIADPDFSYESTVVLEEPMPLDSATPPTEPAVEVIGYDAYRGNLTVRAEAPQAGVLVLSEPWYSERRVWLDGVEVPALRANYGFVAVALPSGAHTVRLVYVPTSFRLGSGLAAASLFVSLMLIVVHLRRRRRGQKDGHA